MTYSLQNRASSYLLSTKHIMPPLTVTSQPLVTEAWEFLGLRRLLRAMMAFRSGSSVNPFSIGFPDLVQRGIVLRPQVRRVEGGRYEFTFEDEETGLAQLDNAERNNRIIKELIANQTDYEKLIIFVGTRDHVRSLHRSLTASKLRDNYESITWITGEGNSSGVDGASFIKARKAESRSIVVNVDVLSEGYDDPIVNTVVMAAPTRSKLQYMQAMGRAIRHDPQNEAKTAYIVEVVDDLPNIRYRIDNRWLYADVSDALEPAVVDIDFSSATDLQKSLVSLYEEYAVVPGDRPEISFDENDRYSLLLFKYYVREGVYQHIPILLFRANRLRVVNAFDYLSEQMPRIRGRVNWRVAMQRADERPEEIFGDDLRQRLIFEAMSNSTALGSSEIAAMPWITFVAFRRRPSGVSDELRGFCEEMVNSHQILDLLERHDYLVGDYLLRMPLPLGRSVGVIVNSATYEGLKQFLTRLIRVKADYLDQDYYLYSKNSSRKGCFRCKVDFCHRRC